MSFPGFDPAEFDKLYQRPEPKLLSTPTAVRGFRIRIELLDSKPRVWRALEVPGDITLPVLSRVLQTAIGWEGTHLHQFRTGEGHDAGVFLTDGDLAEGMTGMQERDIRLDQTVADEGDQLWFDYDFGDGWEHLITVEEVLDAPPPKAACVGGELAGPPEDSGGIHGYTRLAEFVRSGYSAELMPPVFANIWEARQWLPRGWHPDNFDAAKANALVAAVVNPPIPVVEELADLVNRSVRADFSLLRDTLAHPESHGTTEVSAAAAQRLIEPYRALLEVVGDGVPLTEKGNLKPIVVGHLAEATSIRNWWLGPVNREERVWPLHDLHRTARMLGLVSVRKGQLSTTAAARKLMDDPSALLQHITGRLPLGRTRADRDAGWAALMAAAQNAPVEEWAELARTLFYVMGWENSADPRELPYADSPTLNTLMILAGLVSSGVRATGTRPDVAAVARAAMRGIQLNS